MFYLKFFIYLVFWLLMLCAPTISFFVNDNYGDEEYTLDGWLQSDYNLVVGASIGCLMLILAVNYFFGG